MINPNDAFIEELYFQYLRDKNSVSPEWRQFFEKEYSKGYKQKILAIETSKSRKENIQIDKIRDHEIIDLDDKTEITVGSDEFEYLNSIQTKISVNMEESLEVPTATSVRTIPVKVLDENRRIMNKYLQKLKRPKVSFTHILLWALVRALIKYPHMNDAYTKINGKPARIKRKSINIGLAVDLIKKDGTRLLLVPNIKDTQNLNFSEFIIAFDDLIQKTRTGKLDLLDLQDTTVTLTNPGMIGTTFSSPRLMKGQGLIVATGAIDYPTEFAAVRPEVLTNLAVSKVVTITSTYDHRIIQGAESAEFLAYINKLLIGEDLFYDQIFVSLKIPFEPIRWAVDVNYKRGYSLFDPRENIEKSAHVTQMINAYRVRGHLLASTNPLGSISYYYPELDPAYYGFTIWDLDRIFHADDNWESNNIPLRDIIEILRETYCGPIGIEFMHIQDPEKKDWIKRKLERTRSTIEYSAQEKLNIYKKLVDAELFENFLHTKFVGHKRFSLEGSESVIVLMDKLFEKSAESDLKSIIIGMAHRGRLNVLVNNIGKSYEQIFDEFDEEFDAESYQGSGDVKYHLGDWGFYVSPSNKTISIILSPNPSHLELVDPVIEGMVRAYCNEIKDKSYSKVLPILLHGDAAFAGQGIVAETLNLSQLEGYKTGGTIHIIINNQIGFTTSTFAARSSTYATDIAKMIQAPILHVNGNDPEAVCTAAEYAIEFRNRFNCDVIIDLLCYRKYGHNEADEPTYTQPLLYKKIKSMTPVRELYEKELIFEKVLTSKAAEDYKNLVKSNLEKAFTDRKLKSKIPIKPTLYKPGQIFQTMNTSTDYEKLKLITEAVTKIPNGFNIHPKVKALLEKRKEMFESQIPAIDWAFAETLAFGNILLMGKEIRFSGQDSRRGTFSQRHAVLTDMITEDEYIPLNHISTNQALLRIFDSPLSELSVLGFEYGYSVIAKNSLTLWEAQFGDFANGAQAMIDQFIVCAEAKWGQESNLVLLLPHGYDGQGPEHSSARLERFLQLCAQENIIVCNLTTPAQYFHALVRQVLMPFRKPLILMTPKSMLRHPSAVSKINDFTDDKFHLIFDEYFADDPMSVEKVIFCSGKIYYDLLNEISQNEIKKIALIRIEQLYPLHFELLNQFVGKYLNAKELLWVQEEPQNMGAYNYMFPHLLAIKKEYQEIIYVGRPKSASTATGSYKRHLQEQASIIKGVFKDFRATEQNKFIQFANH